MSDHQLPPSVIHLNRVLIELPNPLHYSTQLSPKLYAHMLSKLFASEKSAQEVSGLSDNCSSDGAAERSRVVLTMHRQFNPQFLPLYYAVDMPALAEFIAEQPD